MSLADVATADLIALINYIGKNCDESGSLHVDLHNLRYSAPDGSKISPDSEKLYKSLGWLSCFTYPNPIKGALWKHISLVRIDSSNSSGESISVGVGVPPVREHFEELPPELWDAYLEIEKRIMGFGFKEKVVGGSWVVLPPSE